MDDELFSKYVREAIESLPIGFKDKLDNVAIIIDDNPTPHQLGKVRPGGQSVLLLGLYEGVPLTKRGGGYGIGGTLPDKITLFKEPILYIARTEEAIKQQIRQTILHEIGHHFGMNEREIRNAMKAS